MNQKWNIKLSNLALGGFCPVYWKNSYPLLGNSNQASDMTNVDMTDPSGLTQGPGLVALTNGTQAGKVTTLIKSILDKAVSSDRTFAVGGNLFYELSSTIVSSKAADPVLPHVIDKAAVTDEMGEDVAHFGGVIYYSYNNNTDGDIGKYDLTRDNNNDFIDDWGSTIPAAGATALQKDVPHQFAQTAEFLYTTNGRYITEYDLTNDVMTEQALDLPTGAEAQSHVIADNRLYITTNLIDLTGSNKCQGVIYKWDRNSTSWDPDSIFGLGRVGALYNKDGVVFVFHQDISSTGGYHLGYISGNTVKNVASYKGSLPGYNQVTEKEEFLVWSSDGSLYEWGSGGIELPVRLFQSTDLGYSIVGGIAAPFGTLLTASNESSSYKLSKASGYDVTCSWKSMYFDLSAGIRGKSFINKVVLNTNTLASGARVDLIIQKNLGASTWAGTLSHAIDGAVSQKIFFPKTDCTGFRLDFSFANGSTTAPVKIRGCQIEGHLL